MRCTNPHNNSYWKYGKRGIGFCAEWNEFEPFELWAMKNGYQDNLTLDRINGNLGYSPSNCRWATYREQLKNAAAERDTYKEALSHLEHMVSGERSGNRKREHSIGVMAALCKAREVLKGVE